jgi:putative SOS response-associated peptidase YedK
MENMCGRFVATRHSAVLAEKIDATDEATAGCDPAPDFNVAPTARIAAVVCGGDPGDEPNNGPELIAAAESATEGIQGVLY